jgi:hypothetical protein
VLALALGGCSHEQERWACTDAIDGTAWCFCALADDAELLARITDDDGVVIAKEVEACPAAELSPATKCCQDDGADPFCYCTAVACTHADNASEPLCRCGAYDERLNPDPIVADCSAPSDGHCCVGEVGCICSANPCAAGEELVPRCTVLLDRCNESDQEKVDACTPP